MAGYDRELRGVARERAPRRVVLALPAAFDLAPLVVVPQTLVELIVMVVFVRLIPRLLAACPATAASAAPPDLPAATAEPSAHLQIEVLRRPVESTSVFFAKELDRP